MPNEKHAGSYVSINKFILFIDRINSCKLLDLGAVKHNYTWKGSKNNRGMCIYENLDTGLWNEEWMMLYPKFQLKVLPKVDF